MVRIKFQDYLAIKPTLILNKQTEIHHGVITQIH